VALELNAAPPHARVRLDRRVTLRVRVLLADGAPAQGAGVVVRPRGAFGIPTADLWSTAGSDGWVSIDAPPARYAIEALAERDLLWASRRCELPDVGPGTYVLTLPPPGSEDQVARDAKPRVRAVDGAGRPVPHVLFHRGEDALEVYAACTPGGAPLPLGPVALDGVVLDRDVTVTLPPERTIEGRVTDEAGVPLRGVRVSASRGKRITYDVARTGADGRFRLGRLDQRPFDVVVEAPLGFLTPEPRRARAGDDIEIRLSRGRTATVTVVDANGTVVPGATVKVSAAERSWTWTTDRHGRAPCGGLPDDALRLRVDPPRGRDDVAGAEQDWAPRETIVRLPRAFPITGVVRDPLGRVPYSPNTTWGWQTFTAAAADGRVLSPETNADGSFRIDGLPAGPVTLRFGRPRGGETAIETVAGTRGLVAVVDTGAFVRLRVTNWPRGASNYCAWACQRGAYGIEGRIDGAGEVTIGGLDPDKPCTVIVGPAGDGWVACVRGVRPSHEFRTAQLVRAGTIRGRAPEGTRPRIDELDRDAELDDDGSFAFAGIPPGRWTVALYGEEETPIATRDAEVGDVIDFAR
jgi:hypothetical protein